MKLPLQTRSVVKENYAVICPDGYVDSKVPGWTGCGTNVLISQGMNAGICQLLVTMEKDGKLQGKTEDAQLFFYLVAGECTARVDNDQWKLHTGQFAYIPPDRSYLFQDFTQGTEILIFRKIYLPLAGQDRPAICIGDRAAIPAAPYLGNAAANLQILLPELPSFDLAVNVFSFRPGAHLPFVETHIMEHGLMILEGRAICLLGDEWYMLDRRVSVWMAPYCSQWLAAVGHEALVYIYCKDINRFPW
jgi:(S)-ureidoglycine aminohydrolase